jgi:hypothetical protein
MPLLDIYRNVGDFIPAWRKISEEYPPAKRPMAPVARSRSFLFSPLFHAITRRFTKLTRCIPHTSAKFALVASELQMEQVVRARHPADDEKPLDEVA